MPELTGLFSLVRDREASDFEDKPQMHIKKKKKEYYLSIKTGPKVDRKFDIINNKKVCKRRN